MKRYFWLLFDENASGTGAPGGSPAGTSSVAGGSSEAPTGTGTTTVPVVVPDSSGAPPTPDGFAASDPFAGMEDDFDTIDLGTATVPSQEAPPTAPAAPVTPAAPAAPVVPPVVPEVPMPAAPVANAPASQRSPLEDAITGFKTNEKELASWAGANLFKLSPEDAELLTTNAEEVIPRLMGQVYTQALAAAGNLIRNFVPQMISQGVESTTSGKAKAAEALNEFYAANTHLSPKEHQPVVDKWVKVFRAANPKATRAEAIKFVGNAVSVELGIAPGAAAPLGAKPQPFAPARPGGRQPTQQVVDDPFAGLDQDFDEG